MSLEPWMADFVIDNNGLLEETKRNTTDLIDNILVTHLGYDALEVLAR